MSQSTTAESLDSNLQVVIFVLAGWLVVLGILGMAPIPEIPINDKVLHFFGVSRLTVPPTYTKAY
jgi:hypothetical protein